MQFLLFGGLPAGNTLHDPSWELTKTSAIILDDSPVAWGPMEKPLLLHLAVAKRFKEVEDKVSIDKYVEYLARWGADFQINAHGQVITDIPSPLFGAAERMRVMFEQCVMQIMPRRPPLDLMLAVSVYHWRENATLKQAHKRALQDETHKVRSLQEEVAADQAKIRVLESEVKKLRARIKPR